MTFTVANDLGHWRAFDTRDGVCSARAVKNSEGDVVALAVDFFEPHVCVDASPDTRHVSVLAEALNVHEQTGLTPAQLQARVAELEGALAASEKRRIDLDDTIYAIFRAVGYTAEYAMQWPKEKVSVTFARWFDEQVAR